MTRIQRFGYYYVFYYAVVPSVASFSLFPESSNSRRRARDTTTRRHASVGGTVSSTEKELPLTPFQIFNHHTLGRIEESDRHPPEDDISPIILSPSLEGENVEAARNKTTQNILQISWAEIQRLASPTESTMEERQKFAHEFSSTGGYLLLELEESQALRVQDMWTSVQTFYNGNGNNYAESSDLHHQTIAREGDTHENLGYKFVQTYNTPGDQVLPTTIQDALVANSDSLKSSSSTGSGDAIADSFFLFAEMASQVAAVVAAGALDEDPLVMQSVMDALVHSSSTRFASANHRLSRYVLTESEANPLKESLRAHTDWTLTTPIPLSAIPGLQLWNPNSKEWIAPESLVEALPHPRTFYVVVMAGKWMELVTNQKIFSCIHRVVTQTSQDARLSAPFFLRPKEFVFESLSSQFNDPDLAVVGMSTEEAMTRIHGMFQGFIDLKRTARSLE